MLYILFICLIVVIVSLFVIARGFTVKKALNVPYWMFFLGGDIGGRKPYTLQKYSIIGVPDAVFLDWLAMRFVICELKNRNYTSGVTRYERAQVTLYMALISKWYMRKPVAIVSFGNGIGVRIKFDVSLSKRILGLRDECYAVYCKFNAQRR